MEKKIIKDENLDYHDFSIQSGLILLW
jgi:hypothetical protein